VYELAILVCSWAGVIVPQSRNRKRKNDLVVGTPDCGSDAVATLNLQLTWHLSNAYIFHVHLGHGKKRSFADVIPNAHSAMAM